MLAAAWILYGVLHSVLAGQGFKTRMEVMLKRHYRFYRIAYVIFAFIGLAAITWWQVTMPSPRLFSPGTILLVAGWTCCLSGGLLMMLCIKKYFISLSGLRSLLHEEDGGELMISGIHRYVRHPLYLGTFAFIWGLFLIIPTLSFFIANLIITVYTLIGMQLEEKKLVHVFGDTYIRYMKQVPALIPGGRVKSKEQKAKSNK